MSGHELREEQIGRIRPLTPQQRSRAALKVARAAVASDYTRAEAEEFLQMLGLPVPAREREAS